MMGMNVGQGSGSNEPEVMLDINTTPLIDVMLVLLIMLIITIPAQLHSINLDMPVPKPPKEKKVDPIVIKVDIDSKSQIKWNGSLVATKDDLENRLKDASVMIPQPEIHIRSDGKAKYESAASVLAGAQRLGMNKLGIVGSEQFAD